MDRYYRRGNCKTNHQSQRLPAVLRQMAVQCLFSFVALSYSTNRKCNLYSHGCYPPNTVELPFQQHFLSEIVASLGYPNLFLKLNRNVSKDAIQTMHISVRLQFTGNQSNIYTTEDRHNDSLLGFLQRASNFLRYLVPRTDKPWQRFSHLLFGTTPKETHQHYDTLRWLLEALFSALNSHAEPSEQLHFAMELCRAETTGHTIKYSTIIYFAGQNTLIPASPFALRRFLYAPSKTTSNHPVTDSLDIITLSEDEDDPYQ